MSAHQTISNVLSDAGDLQAENATCRLHRDKIQVKYMAVWNNAVCAVNKQ